MRDIIINFPEQVKKGIELGRQANPEYRYENIIFCGMGGSSIPASLLTTEYPRFIIHQSYFMLPGVTRKDLVVCTSWSGKTKETISSYQKAKELGIPVLVITKADSELAQLASSNKDPLVALPQENIQPRLAVGYMLGATLGALGLDHLISEDEITSDTLEEAGKELAQKIDKKIPLIYSSAKNKSMADAWKILFNENSKIPSFANTVPAMVHNEIASFSTDQKDRFIPIIFQDPDDISEIKKDFNALLAFFNKMEYNYTIVQISSSIKNLEKALNNYILGLWTSFYLAKNLGVNPGDTSLIEEFKSLKN